jgi:hypothetical protein
MTRAITGYWTFFCNPAKWEIDKFLATNTEYDTYQVNDMYKDSVEPGQLGIIRVGIDRRIKQQLSGKPKLTSGIYAIVQTLDIPKISTEVSQFYINEEDRGQKKLRVKIRYLKNLLNRPLSLDTLKLNSITNQDQYLIRGFQRSTMPLRKDAFSEIVSILGVEEQIFSNIELEFADTVDQIAKLESKYKNASPEVKEVISRRIERGKISSAVKKFYHYRCKICEALGQNPLTFQKLNGEYYIETHHIIPVSNLIPHSLGISNLITVCANHHRQFHYGNINIIANTDDELIINLEGQAIKTVKKTINSA